MKWTRSKDGRIESVPRRFWTEALFMGTTKAQGYYLHDDLTGRRYSVDTQRDAKNEADRILRMEDQS
jgi:hypothetical protein